MILSKGNYWINVDKPTGYSSAQIVSIVKKITKAKKVGHAGTLDPIASGVLPIAINQATKTCQYIADMNKKYYFEITWGEFRDTYDIEGKVTQSSNKRPKTIDILNSLSSFIGKIQQIPPKFSAIKVNGQRAYKMARDNKDFTLKSREVEIFDIKLLNNTNNKASFEVTCSKGTYIRSIAKDLSTSLNICGYISCLKRLRVSNFFIENTISLNSIKLLDIFANNHYALSLKNVLHFMTEVKLNNFDAQKISKGQYVKIKELYLEEKITVKITNNNEVIGVGLCSFGILKPINVFNVL